MQSDNMQTDIQTGSKAGRQAYMMKPYADGAN